MKKLKNSEISKKLAPQNFCMLKKEIKNFLSQPTFCKN